MDFITEVAREGMENSSTDTQEYADLWSTYMAAELGENTTRIITTLAKDSNKAPAELFGRYLSNEEEEQKYLWVEDCKKFLRINALNRLNETLGSMDLSINPKAILCETIDATTYDEIKTLGIDEDVAKAKVDSRVSTAI